MTYLLSVEQSNRFKGLLILLVILGHMLGPMGIMSLESLFLLYSFHVTSFLFLPFLFNKDRLTQKNIVKVFRRYYTPYIVFFFVASIFYTLITGHNFVVIDTIRALFIGTAEALKDSVGLSLYWFFPTLVSLLVLIMIENSIGEKYKKMFLLLMALLHIILPILPIEVWQSSPFYSLAALYLFSMGLLVRYIYQKLDWYHVPLWLYVLFLSFLLFIAYGSDYNLAMTIIPDIINEPFNFILHDVIMIVGFFTMLKLSELFIFLEDAGKYSIAIYTIHPFIIAGANMLIPSEPFLMSLVKVFIIVVVTYLLTLIFAKTPIYKIVYPR